MQKNMLLRKQFRQAKAHYSLARRYFSGQVWRYTNQQYKLEILGEILKLIQFTPVQNIWFRDNNYSQIIKDICHIQFSQLQILDLFGNNIVSTQILYLIKMPSLTFLDLGHNKITNLQSLRKVHLPHLQYLSLSFNYIQNFDTLSQLNTKKIQHLWIQTQKYGKVIKNSNDRNIQKSILNEINTNTFNKYRQKYQNVNKALSFVQANPIIAINSVFLDHPMKKNKDLLDFEYFEPVQFLLNDNFAIKAKVTSLLRTELKSLNTLGLYNGQSKEFISKSKNKTKTKQYFLFKKRQQLKIK